jgi:hypothetical protein
MERNRDQSEVYHEVVNFHRSSDAFLENLREMAHLLQHAREHLAQMPYVERRVHLHTL